MMAASLIVIGFLLRSNIIVESCYPANVCFNTYNGASYTSSKLICNSETEKCRQDFTTQDCTGNYAEETCYDYTNDTELDNIGCSGCTNYLFARVYPYLNYKNCSDRLAFAEVIHPLGCQDLVYGGTSYQCTANSISTNVYLGKTDDGACKFEDQFYGNTQNEGCNMVNVSGYVTRSYMEVLYCGTDYDDNSDTNIDTTNSDTTTTDIINNVDDGNDCKRFGEFGVIGMAFVLLLFINL